MAKRGKRYEAAIALIDRRRSSDPEEALAILAETSGTKFDASAEVHLRLGGRGVVGCAEGDNGGAGREAGADEVGAEDLAKRIQSGWLEFDAAVATPDMMRIVSPLGSVLGPR